MGNFNRQAATLLGAEWRPQTSRYIVLNSLTQAVAQRIRPGNVTLADIDFYITRLIGTPGLAIEVVSTLTPTLDTPVDVYPGTDTGATLSSWVNESSATASYTKVAKKTPTTTYLQPNTQASASLLFRATSAVSAGKRVVSIQQGMNIAYPSVAPAVSPWFFGITGGGGAFAQVSGVMNIGGTSYQTGLAATTPATNYTPYLSPAMMTNPSTKIPWTLTEANTLCNGTNTFGITKASSTYTLEHRLAGLWMTVQTCAENRVGVAYSTTAQTAGWQRYVMSGPDGGAISAFSANTYYWIVIYILSTQGGSAVVLPALKDADLVLATSASASTGDFREAIDCVIDRGCVTTSSINAGEMIPVMIENPAATFNADSQPYVALTATSIGTGPAQQVTSAGANTYAGVRVTVGWATGSAPPDAPLLVELRHGAGAATGGGTLDGTATIPANQLTNGNLTDVVAAFSSPVTTSATQYHVFFRSTSTNPWSVGRLDTGSDVVSTISTANVENQGIGGTTDSYVDTSGSATSRYDLAVLLVASITNPASVTATLRAGL